MRLKGDNHRSGGTDILRFGDDVLIGVFANEAYQGVDVLLYPANESQAYSTLITTTHKVRKRLVDGENKKWSLAILVPTKRLTRLVSDAFRSPPAGMRPIHHTAAVDIEAAILAAEIASFLMQPPDLFHRSDFIKLVCNYFHGKGGDDPSRSAIDEAASVLRAYEDWIDKQKKGKEVRKNSIILPMMNSYEAACEVLLSGDPDKDWHAIRTVLEAGDCARLRDVAIEVRNIRLLERGSQLRQELSHDWRTFNGYPNALAITRKAFIREHFSAHSKVEEGMVVMNMHKSKGKQFDEVIIFEGWPTYVRREMVSNADRIVRSNLTSNLDSQCRQNLRVSITRAKKQTTIPTPDKDPCVVFSSVFDS